MKSGFALLFCVTLGACGSGGDDSAKANQAAAVSTDAVTAEAVTDTQAAEADALKAADAELDNLDNASIANGVSNGTAVVEY